MVAKPVKLATRSFSKTGDAHAFFSAMLNRYQVGERVSDDDALDLAAVLERHPEYQQKIGSGLDHFEIMMTEHGTQCFRIARIDGTGTDFSTRYGVTGRPPSRKQEVSQAFRRAVRFDLYKARDAFFKEHANAAGQITCAVTNEWIGRDEAHMDHRPPMTFEMIVITFLAHRGLSLDAVPITTGQDEQVSAELTDVDLSEAFRQYHAQVAYLDLVKRTVNLSQASRSRLRPSRITLS